MPKLTLQRLGDLSNETSAITALNNNSTDTETALENTLSRDGSSPNQMDSALDMNSHPIVNLPFPVTPSSPLRLQDYTSSTAVPTGGATGQVLTKGSDDDFDTDWTTIVGLTSSSSSTAIGSIASYSNTSGSFITGTPTFNVANLGNAALYSNVDAPPTGYTGNYSGLVFELGETIPPSKQFGSGTVPVMQGIVGTVVVPASNTTTAQASGGAFFGLTKASATSGGGANTAGLYAQGATAVDNASVWGANLLATNTDGGTNLQGHDCNYIAALEIDLNLWKLPGGTDPVITSGHAYGLTIAGGSNLGAPIVGSSGVVIDRINFAGNIPWYYGVSTYAGATINAFAAGPASITANSNSQNILWQSTNGSNATVTAKSFSDAAGSLYFDPASFSNINLRDGNGTTLFSTTPGLGGSGVRVNSFITPGIVTNTALGLLATSAVGAGVLTFLTTPSSANLATTITDETGSGSLVFATSPTLVTPNLGTPSAAVLTNATGTAAGLTAGNATTAATASAVAVGGITGMGTGVATFLTTPTSANLKAAVTDETGSGGALVFATSPTLTTPVFSSIVNTGTLTLPTSTDTLVGKATTDTFTNKTYDTAGTGNSFSINGVAVTANTGTGSVARATSPTFVTPVLGAATATTINGVTLDNNAWTTYTPTVTPQTGALTTATVTATGRYKQIGKTVICQTTTTITNIGVGVPAGNVNATLPLSAQTAGIYTGSSYETASTGNAGACLVNGTFTPTLMNIKNLSAATYWVNGYTVTGTVTYEIP